MTEAKNNGLKTDVDRKTIMANSMNELIKDIASRKDKYEEIKDRYNAIIDNDISKIVSLKTYTKNENKTLDIVTLLAP